jgi:DNA-directed RNA polymerase subunit RPC12/RpoP
MANFTFNCSACSQQIQADDAWADQVIQCPLCNASVVVPKNQKAASTLGKQLVAVPSENKLKAGPTQVARSATGTGAVVRSFQKKEVKKQSPVVKFAIVAAVLVAIVAAGYYAMPYLPFFKKEGDAGAGQQAGTPGAPGQGDAGQVAEPPPPKEVPMTPPAYTLDVAKAKISEGKVNGSIAGTNFIPDLARLDKIGPSYVLNLRQGGGQTPDRGVLVHLKLGPTESPTGHVFSVSKEMKGTAVSHVTKVWKTNPRFAAQQKNFPNGYALKLEFGELTESNTIPGKIFLAFPDTEQSVVGGVFNASTTIGTGTTEAPAATQVIQDPQAESQKAAFQKRYGIRR